MGIGEKKDKSKKIYKALYSKDFLMDDSNEIKTSKLSILVKIIEMEISVFQKT